MKAKLNTSLLYVLAMTALMACSTTRNASAQTGDEPNYQNNDDYNNDSYNDNNDDYNYDNNNDDYYNEPSESDVNINVFVNELSPYGRWINSPSYGQVWICNETGFAPYQSRGHWVYTNYGWTWASDYNWGWAPFHYGRWAYDPFYGWMWVPGYQWGPAWVGWRTGGDYYGWAPLAPGINISVGFGFGNYMPADRWCFVPRRYIGYSNFNHYMVNRQRNVTIIRNTTIINNTNIYRNTRYVTGPNRIDVERATGRRINTVRVSNDTRPGASRIENNNTIRIYRPQANRNNDNRNNNTRNNQQPDRRAGSVGQQSHNFPQQNHDGVRVPQRRDDDNNNRNNNNRRPDERDRINNTPPNGNDNRINNDPRNRQDNRMNNDRNNDIRNIPQQNGGNHVPDINRNNPPQNRQDNNNNHKPQYNWNDRNNGQNSNRQVPNYNQQRNVPNRSFPKVQPQQRTQPQPRFNQQPAPQRQEPKKKNG